MTRIDSGHYLSHTISEDGQISQTCTDLTKGSSPTPTSSAICLELVTLLDGFANICENALEAPERGCQDLRQSSSGSWTGIPRFLTTF
ncbi:hypothetical protein J6590_089628 [Homalodisca vitripennis]|nr:hypothetical protein J6590_089628 [Homalodisca vitripennis]